MSFVKEDALCLFAALGVHEDVNDAGTIRRCRQLTLLKKAIVLAKAELHISTALGLERIVHRAKNVLEYLNSEKARIDTILLRESCLTSKSPEWLPIGLRRPRLVKISNFAV